MKKEIPNGVMFNAYPDSIGSKLADTVTMLRLPEFESVFSLFYILPTIFNSDLDRGFSVIDYDLNGDLVSRGDLNALQDLDIKFKFDLVLNHLSVASFQFQNMLKHGDDSKYKNFFIDWNEFWHSHGKMGSEGYIIPRTEYLDKLFMRKPGLPILKVCFPDGIERPYWNTFYQQINYPNISAEDLHNVLSRKDIRYADAQNIAVKINEILAAKKDIKEVDLGEYSDLKDDVISAVEQRRQYLGQMDLNAQSQEVWDFYDETLSKFSNYGASLVRLDAFAYLHKQPGEVNFFNKPGTWEYLEKVKQLADKHELILLPEIHSEYGKGLHEEVSDKGFTVYDFFFPGLVIHALEKGTSKHILRWISELIEKNISTVNMLGCHDGIPVLDLKGEASNGLSNGLLSDEEIEEIVEIIIGRGGRVKNLFGPDGKKISYYQVNATFFSALGEDEYKMLLARAIQIFMPGIPQVWYLDLFVGKNDYDAADKGGTAGHKEINRTTLALEEIKARLEEKIVRDQLELLRLRNTSPAFNGDLFINHTVDNQLSLSWKNKSHRASLNADLRDFRFTITHTDEQGREKIVSYG